MDAALTATIARIDLMEAQEKTFRVLALMMTDYSGSGGIAEYCRSVLRAFCKNPDCRELTSFPRNLSKTSVELPDKLIQKVKAGKSRLLYLLELFHHLRQDRSYDILVCGHLYLLPIAYLVKLWIKAPLVLFIYGKEAWKPTSKILVNFLASRSDLYVACSDYTSKHFLSWAGPKTDPSHLFVLPGAVDLETFSPGEKNPSLVEKHRLNEKQVLFTLARLDPDERYKGIDEVIEVLPDLCKEIPNLVYLVAGAGADRERLIRKAASLGLDEQVIFTGYLREEQKVDYYRLADVFVMPGRGEGFGIVYLEALACGVPVIGSKLDASRETLRNGDLGILVDPYNPAKLRAAIQTALGQKAGNHQQDLSYFSVNRLEERVDRLIGNVLRIFPS